MSALALSRADVRTRSEELVAYLETGEPAPSLFVPDVFVDFTLPRRGRTARPGNGRRCWVRSPRPPA